MNSKKNHERSTQHTPRFVGEILHDYLMNSNEPLAIAYREHHNAMRKEMSAL